MTTNDPGNANSMRVVNLMLPYLGRHWGLLAIGIVGTIVGALLSFSVGLAIKHVVDGVPSDAAAGYEYLNKILFIALPALVSWTLIDFCTGYSLLKVAQRVMRDLRNNVFSSLIGQKVSYLERYPSGELQTRLIADTNVVGGFATGQVPGIVTASISVIGGTVGALFISVKLTLIVVAALPFVFLPLLVWGQKLRDYGWKIQQQTADLGTVSGEAFRNIKVVQVHSKEAEENSRFSGISDGVAATCVRSSRLQMGISQSVNLIAQCALVVLLWIAAKGIYSGVYTVGELMAFAYFNGLIVSSAGTFFGLATALKQTTGSAERLIEYLSLEIDTQPVATRSLPIGGCIEFADVKFRYPARPEVDVLKGVSFAVEAGSHTVIVGPSGAGKSAIFELLLGLYVPESGKILVDGLDSREMGRNQLRASIGYVPQKDSLVSGTVFDNIVYGASGADEARVMEAARIACAHEFIMQLPQGYRTNLGEVASRLSGGERQRISLARALIREPKILLLDEDKSALDASNERRVTDSVRKWAAARGATVISIAHRLSSLGRADRIVVVDDGVVAGVGSHAELLAGCEAYQALVTNYSRDSAPVFLEQRRSGVVAAAT